MRWSVSGGIAYATDLVEVRPELFDVDCIGRQRLAPTENLVNGLPEEAWL
jgi:hypothetical protein